MKTITFHLTSLLAIVRNMPRTITLGTLPHAENASSYIYIHVLALCTISCKSHNHELDNDKLKQKYY